MKTSSVERLAWRSEKEGNVLVFFCGGKAGVLSGEHSRPGTVSRHERAFEETAGALGLRVPLLPFTFNF
jgi:hypothetical protein